MKGRLLALALAASVLGGCATKRDLRDLRAEVDSLRVSQEALLRAIQRQNAAILDTLAAKDVRLRGDLTNQLVQIERQLVQVQELTGQGQQRLVELREALRQREEALRAQATAAPVAGNPDELFATALDALQRGSYTTARAGFEEFVQSFPRDPRAAEAQLYTGEALERAKDLPGALAAYARVLELFPDSPRAATALYRAALLELERDNRDRARDMLRQVTVAYPRSPEAGQARERLQNLR
jgi:tol-pal system protein YbgF